MIRPKRGDIYLVNFDPTLGAEIRKTRPALILQNDVALLHDSTAARVGALFQLLVQDTTAQDFGLPSSAIRLRM